MHFHRLYIVVGFIVIDCSLLKLVLCLLKRGSVARPCTDRLRIFFFWILAFLFFAFCRGQKSPASDMKTARDRGSLALATHGALELSSRADVVGAQVDLVESVIHFSVFIHARARLG